MIVTTCYGESSDRFKANVINTVVLSEQMADGSCPVWLVETFGSEQKRALNEATIEAPPTKHKNQLSIFEFPNFLVVRFFDPEYIMGVLRDDKGDPNISIIEQQVHSFAFDRFNQLY